MEPAGNSGRSSSRSSSSSSAFRPCNYNRWVQLQCDDAQLSTHLHLLQVEVHLQLRKKEKMEVILVMTCRTTGTLDFQLVWVCGYRMHTHLYHLCGVFGVDRDEISYDTFDSETPINGVMRMVVEEVHELLKLEIGDIVNLK